MLNRFSVMLSSPETSIPMMVNDPAGQWVHASDYAELKEKCERYVEMCDELDARCNGLKNERTSDLNQLGGLQAENARLKAEVERLKNNCDYLDKSLDDEIDRSADYSRLHAAVFAKVAEAKAELDKCGTLETPGIKAWRILEELLTPPPLP